MDDKGAETDFHRLLKQEQELPRTLKKEALKAFDNEDAGAFFEALSAMAFTSAWRATFLAIRRRRPPSLMFRNAFAGLWVHHGDNIRDEVSDDLLLGDALRVLMPPYTGSRQVLYRGDGWINRKRRSYGLCWTTSIEVARSFAAGAAKCYTDGGVLLRAVVPTTSIIACLHEIVPDTEENEYIVDRRALRGIKVEAIERFNYAAL